MLLPVQVHACALGDLRSHQVVWYRRKVGRPKTVYEPVWTAVQDLNASRKSSFESILLPGAKNLCPVHSNRLLVHPTLV